uniref:WW domain-containing protein n=1 Tax=Rhizochromulina marina TaxID=1034831 RepID=A0A7S2RR72_9STRA
MDPEIRPSFAAGWVETLDEVSGRAFYMNSITGETTWEKPAELTAPPPRPPKPSFAEMDLSAMQPNSQIARPASASQTSEASGGRLSDERPKVEIMAFPGAAEERFSYVAPDPDENADASSPLVPSKSWSSSSASAPSSSTAQLFAPLQGSVSGVGGFTGEGHGRVPVSNADALLYGKNHGTCLCRVSMRAILLKDWKPCLWVFEPSGDFLVFRSKDDYLGYHKNPYLDAEMRQFLVKACVAFGQKVYHCSQVRTKAYRGGRKLATFTIDEMRDYGPATIVKLASPNVSDMEELAHLIQHRIASANHQAAASQGQGAM